MQCETAEDFAELVVRLVATDEIAALDFAALQESRIARKQQPSFRAGRLGEQDIIGVAVVPGIETEHAQVRGETAKVAVDDEPGIFENDRRGVREDVDVIAV